MIKMEYKLPGNVSITDVANPSFLFDKCLNANDYSNSKDKNNRFNDLTQNLKSKYMFGNLDVYTAYKKRMESVVEGFKRQGYAIETFKLKSTAGLCIGMGRTSAIENGITLERNLGIPIIPSSSIKGVLRNYVSLYGNDKEKSEIDKYFGSDDSENPKSGEVDFLSAYMISDLTKNQDIYKVDIINNHFPDYYNKDDVPPNDWFNPIPVYFLRLSEGVIFQFTIIGKDKNTISEVLKILEVAFKEVGVGGKTAVGYGRMIKV